MNVIAANSVDPDPFVLQTYKSTMCFLTSFLVLFLGESYHFSPYGLISGLLWVIGGICGIFGIRNSGLGISVGTWSAVTVLVSFTWGIFMFDESVVSVWKTTWGISMMIIGVAGMAFFSSPIVIEETSSSECNMIDCDVTQQHEEDNIREQNTLMMNLFPNAGENNDLDDLKEPLLDEEKQATNLQQKTESESSDHTSPSTTNGSVNDDNNVNVNNDYEKSTVLFLGREWNRRQLGIMGAVMDGILGGGNLIPMHYSTYHGVEYITSFATGAIIITILFWFIRWGYNIHETKSIMKGYEALPSMHFRTLIGPGVLAGTVWSLGNIGQIISVTYLGESIGMSIVQSSMIVSGILGIVYFREITGWKPIFCWSLSALVTFIGIIFLSHQHKA